MDAGTMVATLVPHFVLRTSKFVNKVYGKILKLKYFSPPLLTQ